MIRDLSEIWELIQRENSKFGMVMEQICNKQKGRVRILSIAFCVCERLSSPRGEREEREREREPTVCFYFRSNKYKIWMFWLLSEPAWICHYCICRQPIFIFAIIRSLILFYFLWDCFVHKPILINLFYFKRQISNIKKTIICFFFRILTFFLVIFITNISWDSSQTKFSLIIRRSWVSKLEIRIDWDYPY